MQKYIFADGPLRIKEAEKADPQAIGEAFEKSAKKTDGRPDLNIVHDEAQSRNHPLHKHLEWDDKIAGRAHRIDQLRAMVRMIRIEDEEHGVVPAYVNLRADHDRHRYYPTDQVKRSSDLQIVLMKQAKRDLEAARIRYRMLADICEGIAELVDRLDQKIAQTETSARAQ